MKILITGASGYIGNKLAHKLADKGHEIHAMVRSSKSDQLLQHKRIRIFYGDLLDHASISKAIEGCHQVYHTAGLARLWVKDPAEFYQLNVIGTENVLSAALACGVKKFVFTSSCGVWASSLVHPLTETDPRINSFDNDYDLSKCLAEKLVKEYCHKGLFTVIVNPPRVYGPGLMRHSSAVNRFLVYLLKNKIAFVPGNFKAQANYAYIDDVVNGHVLAMEKGLGGERYILGGENASYLRIIQLVRKLEHTKTLILRLPKAIAKIFSWIEIGRARLGTHEPLIVPSVINRLTETKMFDCSKAVRQLGYTITPLETGLGITLEHLKKSL